MKHLGMDKKLLQKVYQMQCEICRSLSHPLRLAIVNRLDRGDTAAADLIADLGASKANLSKHMAFLTHAGIVESRREGRNVFYHLTDPEIHKACAIMRSILYRRLKQGEKLALAIGAAKVHYQ
jgi:ArsR family transcriptional regulator